MTSSRWEEQHSSEWSMGDTVWRRLRVLKLMRSGDYYATWLCWHHETGEFIGWYVNFQLPFVRSPIGFDTFDLEIDLDVAPDLTWVWKDETEHREGIKWGDRLGGDRQPCGGCSCSGPLPAGWNE